MVEINTIQDLGANLRIKARRKVTQVNLAVQAGLSLYKVQQIFNGNPKVCIADYSKVAMALGLKIKFVLKGCDHE